MWLECIGVVSRCCCKEVYRHPHNNYYFSLLHLLALFGSSIPTSLSIFKMFFRSLRRKNAKWRFFTSCGVYVNCAIMAMLYIHSIGNQL